MSDLTAVSLFAGIEGIGLALERAGVRVVASVEIDPDCRSVIARHFPQTAIFDDVRTVTGDQLRAAGFVPGRGILTGGFPCQDLSIAGRRAGLGGARSGLFWEIMRLADELRPRWLLLENVPGLLSAVCPCPGDGTCVAGKRAVRCGEWRGTCGHREWFPDVPHQAGGGACAGGCMASHGGAMGTVLGAMGKRRYGIAYRILDAQFTGVPQRRRRVFIAGCLGDWAAPVEVLLEPEGGEGNLAPGPAAGTRVAGTLAASAGSGGLGGVGQSRNSLTSRLDETACSTLQGGGRRGYRIDAEGAAGGQLVAHTITSREGKGPDSDATSGDKAARRVYPLALRGRDGGSTAECGEDGDPAFGLRTPGGGSSYPMVCTLGGEGVTHALTSEGSDASEDGTGRGTPVVALAVAGDFSHGLGDAQAVRAANGQPGCVTTPVAVSENQRGELVESAVAHQLSTGGGKAGQGYPAVRMDSRVRRLTPLETERLQGLPDEWTRWLANGTEQSDAARYRQVGNSVAVPCVQWITERIVAVDASLIAANEGAA